MDPPDTNIPYTPEDLKTVMSYLDTFRQFYSLLLSIHLFNLFAPERDLPIKIKRHQYKSLANNSTSLSNENYKKN